MNDQPQTSVIIPVFNGERFVLDAVMSVCSQLGEYDEVLVVDDASTDGTRSVLDIPERRLRVLSGTGNGPSAARNIGLSAARGEMIAFLDHDDLWPPGRHAALLTMLSVDASINAVAGRICIKVEEDASVGSYQAFHGRYGPTSPCTCLYRRTLIEQAGRFDEAMRYCEDLDYYQRLVEAGMKLAYCDHDSLVYRRHAGNATNSQPPQRDLLLDLVARKLARARASRQ